MTLQKIQESYELSYLSGGIQKNARLRILDVKTKTVQINNELWLPFRNSFCCNHWTR
jgi:hypothetical protein